MECKSCKQLSLKSNNLSDSGVSNLSKALDSKVSVIEHLDLSSCGITKTGLFFLFRNIRANVTLHSLVLDYNNFESNQAFFIIGKTLSASCRLKTLKMRHCGLNDNFGAVFGENLQKNKNLVSVDFSHNMLTSQTLRFLAASIKMNTSRLEHLNLSHNLFDDTMGTKLIEALGHNSILQSVDLSDNNFTDLTAKIALSVVMRNDNQVSLNFRKNMVTPMLVDKIERLSSMRTVTKPKDDIDHLTTTKLSFAGVP